MALTVLIERDTKAKLVEACEAAEKLMGRKPSLNKLANIALEFYCTSIINNRKERDQRVERKREARKEKTRQRQKEKKLQEEANFQA